MADARTLSELLKKRGFDWSAPPPSQALQYAAEQATQFLPTPLEQDASALEFGNKGSPDAQVLKMMRSPEEIAQLQQSGREKTMGMFSPGMHVPVRDPKVQGILTAIKKRGLNRTDTSDALFQETGHMRIPRATVEGPSFDRLFKSSEIGDIDIDRLLKTDFQNFAKFEDIADLSKQDPSLQKVLRQFRYFQEPAMKETTGGAFLASPRGGGTIKINPNQLTNMGDARRILGHETHHGVDYSHGQPYGTNPDIMEEQLSKIAQQYRLARQSGKDITGKLADVSDIPASVWKETLERYSSEYKHRAYRRDLGEWSARLAEEAEKGRGATPFAAQNTFGSSVIAQPRSQFSRLTSANSQLEPDDLTDFLKLLQSLENY